MEKGDPTEDGMKLLLDTLKESIASEVPVRVNELFLKAFYDPSVWRKATETMQQFIVRREQDFHRLEEVLPKSSVPEQVRAMMLLTFAGLDAKEQLAVLASCGNEYDYKKLAHALRIQFPNSVGKYVHKKDLLGWSQSKRDYAIPHALRSKWKAGGRGKSYALAVHDEDGEADETYEHESVYEAVYEATDDGDATYDPAEDYAYAYSDDETLDALLQDYDDEDPQAAEALATFIQSKSKKKVFGTPPTTATSSSQQSFPFKAHGEMSFEAKARENRRNAVKFLKTVTPCTSCGRKGHWQGDDECPNKGKKGKSKGKGSKNFKKSQSLSPQKKKPATTFFVLHDKIESDGDHDNEPTGKTSLARAPSTSYEQYLADGVVESQDYEIKFHSSVDIEPNNYASTLSTSFTSTFSTSTHEVLMVLKDDSLCEHSVYHGGSESKFFRGANGLSRYIACKESDCDKVVISGKRKDASSLWRYLVMVALCTKWGQAARSRGLFQRVCKVRGEALDARERQQQLGDAASGSPTSPASPSWSVIHGQPQRHPPAFSGTSTPSDGGYPRAKIKRQTDQCFWLYGVRLMLGEDLPPFPDLGGEDCDVLQPLPHDGMQLGPESPYPGATFAQVASSLEGNWFCQHVLVAALENKEPLTPEHYRLAFYLYGRVKLAHAAGMRMTKSGQDSQPGKRVLNPDEMVTSRCIRVPLSPDPHGQPDGLFLSDCEVMMVSGDFHVAEQTLLSAPEDPPGLAILDSGCTRTMHGAMWSEAFEKELNRIGLTPKSRSKNQAFKGIGGQLTSDTVKVFPVGIAKIHGELHSAETPGNAPLLLSRPFMQELGTVIDLGNNTVSFTAIDIKGLPLIKTSRGHLAISLLDFNLDNLSEFEEAVSPSTHEAGTHEGHEAFGLDGLDEYDQVPEGWNPDDWHDECDAMWHLRQDVANYEELMHELQGDGHMSESEDPRSTDHTTEDVNVFQQLLTEQHLTVRKTSNKKAKKLASLSAAVDGDDWQNYRILTGKRAISSKPPYGKTWLKQLFAGQMGLTVLCALAGMSIGVPLDFSSTQWDATTSTGVKAMNQDLLKEDPFCLVITQPCGPWGNWSRFNLAKGGAAALTVLDQRTEGRKILKMVNKTVVDRLKMKRHVFLEQPRGSQWLDEPEMADVKALINSGDLLMFEVDGCCVGYMDFETGLPNLKPSTYVTSMIAAESILSGLKCSRTHQHQPLEGANAFGLRTAQAAEWPTKLNKLVMDLVLQQAAIEFHAPREIAEVYAGEIRPAEDQGGKQPKKRRTGRIATLRSQYNAPPVYVRPSQPSQPAVPESEQLDVPIASGDDSSFRAAQAAELDPVLNLTEQDRRRNWLAVDADIRKTLRDLHVNFGHPTNVTLQRILRRQRARIDVIKAVDFMSCDVCGESLRRRRPKPVRLPGKYEFNNHLQVDVFYARDAAGTQFSFLNIICDATGFQVVSCLGQSQGPPASRAVLRHFLTTWSSWAGLPQSLQVDRGKEYLAFFSEYLKEFGVEQEVMPLESPWKNGKVEKAGHLWKELFVKTVRAMQITGLEDVILATSIVSQTRNAFPRSSGYAPNQWVLGVPELRLPGSLLQDGKAERLEVLEACEKPGSIMAKTVGIREAARVAQIMQDTDSRVRRALLHQSTPTRGPYPVGSYVYFYRLQAPPGSDKTYRWFGPARVIGVELRNQRRLEDPEPATEGGQPHSYCLRYGTSVVLVSGEQLRFASEDELIAAHMVPQEILEPSYARGARSYVDLRLPLPSVPQPPQDPPALQSPITPDPAVPFLAPAPADQQRSQRQHARAPPPLRMQRQPTLMQAAQQVPSNAHEVPVPDQHGDLGEERPDQRTGDGGQTALDFAMNDLDRLDGHPNPPTPTTSALPSTLGYEPVRQMHPQEPAQPYLAEAEDWTWTCPMMPSSIREHNMKRLLNNYEELSGSDVSSEEDDPEQDQLQEPADAFLTGKAVRSEVNLKQLSPEDRAKFDASMAKEWASWQKFSAVEVLSEEQVAALPKDVQIVGTRWVHTDKNSKPRLMAEALSKRTGKTKEQIRKEFPFEAKSRLVVQGNQEDGNSIRSDYPTASLLSFNLVCVIAVLNNWIIWACDASTAYLQSQGISRLLILRSPRPPPPAVSSTDLLRAKGSIYGTKDAGRAWWKKLYRILVSHGWKMSKIEPALFYLVIKGKLCGILITHVDDLFCAGEGSEFKATIDMMEKEIHLKVKKEEFRFCGKNLIQRNGSIEIDQFDAIESIDYMVLSKDRRQQVNAPLTEHEKSLFRALIGQLGWVARQSRPDIMVNVSMAAQSMGSPKIRDVIQLNKAVKMLKETADAKWKFVASDLKLEDCVVFCFADSSFANGEHLKSQCGYVVGFTSPKLKDGEETPIYVLEAYSGSIKRVCRSTLAAEANGFLAGAEAADFLRMLLLEVLHPGVRITELENEYRKAKVLCFTDARSLEATLNKDAGQPGDKRVRILCAQIKEMIGTNDFKDDDSIFAKWVDTSTMLADVLTKLGCEREPMLVALETGRYSTEPSQDAKDRKVAIRAARHARKLRNQSMKAPPNDPPRTGEKIHVLQQGDMA